MTGRLAFLDKGAGMSLPSIHQHSPSPCFHRLDHITVFSRCLCLPHVNEHKFLVRERVLHRPAASPASLTAVRMPDLRGTC